MSTTQWDTVLAVAVDDDRDHIQGPAEAAVTLVEYGDYECPYCGAAYPIVKDLQARMGDKLRFVFRNFPISTSHPHAEQAAEAAEAGAAQGRFWEMHDLLYENQARLGDQDRRTDVTAHCNGALHPHILLAGRSVAAAARQLQYEMAPSRT